MYDHTLSIAKRIADANPFEQRHVAAEWNLSKRDYEAEIEKRSEDYRRPGESRQQAFTRFATETPEGKALMKAALAAPPAAPPKFADQDLVPEKPPGGPASEELMRLARSMAKERKLTVDQAAARILSDPTRKDLLAEILREERRARTMISESRWPLNDAERQSETRRWMDGNPKPVKGYA
jgi:hypothetical protein